MEKETAAVQEEAVHMQIRLGQLVEQTSVLLRRVRESAARKDVRTLHILADQLRLRDLQYEELYRRMEGVAARLDGLVCEANGGARNQTEAESARVTAVMLQQMMAQTALERQHIETLQEELRLEKDAAEMEGTARDIDLLERLQTALRNSKT